MLIPYKLFVSQDTWSEATNEEGGHVELQVTTMQCSVGKGKDAELKINLEE